MTTECPHTNLVPWLSQIGDRLGWECHPTIQPLYPWQCKDCGEMVKLTHRAAAGRGHVAVMVF